MAVTNYVKVLYEKDTPVDVLKDALDICNHYPDVSKVLLSPAVHLEEKKKLIERIFPEQSKALMVTLCKYGSAGKLAEIAEAYQSYVNRKNGVLEATIYYVTEPTDDKLEQLKENLKNSYNAKDVYFKKIEDKSLVGGFMVRIGNTEYDYSLQRQIERMKRALIRTEVK